jgi:hypothetical protein
MDSKAEILCCVGGFSSAFESSRGAKQSRRQKGKDTKRCHKGRSVSNSQTLFPAAVPESILEDGVIMATDSDVAIVLACRG